MVVGNDTQSAGDERDRLPLEEKLSLEKEDDARERARKETQEEWDLKGKKESTSAGQRTNAWTSLQDAIESWLKADNRNSRNKVRTAITEVADVHRQDCMEDHVRRAADIRAASVSEGNRSFAAEAALLNRVQLVIEGGSISGELLQRLRERAIEHGRGTAFVNGAQFDVEHAKKILFDPESAAARVRAASEKSRDRLAGGTAQADAVVITESDAAAQGDAEREPPEPIAKSPRGSVLLFGRQDTPIVKGVEKEELTAAQYNVVLALLQAGANGLSKDRLDRKSGHTESRKILRRLADSDSDWESVISFPGTPGIGYRIV